MNLETTESLLRLERFSPSHASTVASWAPTDQALRWLAPATQPPLTSQKVLQWITPNTHAFVLLNPRQKTLVGYGEVNPVRADPRSWWLGHIVIAPDYRRQGLGTAWVRRLTQLAHGYFGADRVSLIVFPDNLPAIAAYNAAGFDFSGVEIHRFRPDAELQLLHRYEWHS